MNTTGIIISTHLSKRIFQVIVSEWIKNKFFYPNLNEAVSFAKQWMWLSQKFWVKFSKVYMPWLEILKPFLSLKHLLWNILSEFFILHSFCIPSLPKEVKKNLNLYKSLSLARIMSLIDKINFNYKFSLENLFHKSTYMLFSFLGLTLRGPKCRQICSYSYK